MEIGCCTIDNTVGIDERQSTVDRKMIVQYSVPVTEFLVIKADRRADTAVSRLRYFVVCKLILAPKAPAPLVTRKFIHHQVIKELNL